MKTNNTQKGGPNKQQYHITHAKI